MADETFDILEYQVLREGPVTHLYIRVSQAPDSPPMGGWYTKTIGEDQASLEVLRAAIVSSNYLTEWARGAPKD